MCMDVCSESRFLQASAADISSMSHTWKPKRLNRKTSQTQKSLENWGDKVSFHITA